MILICYAHAPRHPHARAVAAASAQASSSKVAVSSPQPRNIQGELLVMDAGSLTFRGNHPMFPGVASPSACATACASLPGCNAFNFCSKQAGCGSGCKAYVKQHPTLAVNQSNPLTLLDSAKQLPALVGSCVCCCSFCEVAVVQLRLHVTGGVVQPWSTSMSSYMVAARRLTGQYTYNLVWLCVRLLVVSEPNHMPLCMSEPCTCSSTLAALLVPLSMPPGLRALAAALWR